jgi:hypothetical protein
MIAEPRKRCILKFCNETALYGKARHKQIHCEEHKDEGEYNLVEKNCSSCGFPNIVNDKQLCGNCDETMIKSTRLLKQKIVKAYLDRKKYKYTSYDKVIDPMCGLERPDFVFDGGDHFVIVEVDEDQHKKLKYRYENNEKILIHDCETARMINISQMMGLPTIFIRFNPDKFTIKNEQQNVSQGVRHLVLSQWIDAMMDKKAKNIPFLSTMYLFYDDYDKQKVELEPINFI